MEVEEGGVMRWWSRVVGMGMGERWGMIMYRQRVIQNEFAAFGKTLAIYLETLADSPRHEDVIHLSTGGRGKHGESA